MKTIYAYYLETGADTLYENIVYECGCVEEHNLNMQYMIAQFEGTTEASNFEEYTKAVCSYMYIDTYDKVTFNNGDLILEKHYQFICSECHEEKQKGSRIYCIDTPRPTGFDNMELHHGIVAYQRDNIEAGIKHLVKVLEDENYETCCSTDHIGTVGATFIAEVITASNEDLYTRVDHSNGHRYYDNIPKNIENIIYDIKDHNPGTTWNDEFVTRKHQLQSLWYKTSASDDEKEAMMSLAEFLGVEVKIIEEQDKINIWDDEDLFGIDPDGDDIIL